MHANCRRSAESPVAGNWNKAMVQPSMMMAIAQFFFPHSGWSLVAWARLLIEKEGGRELPLKDGRHVMLQLRRMLRRRTVGVLVAVCYW
jgi:hypothetical protein